MSTTYQKIPGPFVRDHTTNKLMWGEWTSPELKATLTVPWEFTEKVDGTNIRVIWDGHRVSFAGRTDNAQLPPTMLAYLNEHFGGEDRETLFEQKFGESEVVIYGEGFGPKINGGGKYGPDPRLAVFDVVIGGMFLLRENVEDIANYFGVDVAPVLNIHAGRPDTLLNGIEFIEAGFTSTYGDFPAEGIVGKTKAGLLDRRGNRIIVKIKTRDFA